MNRTVARPLALGVLLLASFGSLAQAIVTGNIVARANNKGPAPGLTVSLVHPKFGRSASATTDAYGHYMLADVPFRPDPYYLEVYWGRKLIFRSAQPVTQHEVIVPTITL